MKNIQQVASSFRYSISIIRSAIYDLRITFCQQNRELLDLMTPHLTGKKSRTSQSVIMKYTFYLLILLLTRVRLSLKRIPKFTSVRVGKYVSTYWEFLTSDNNRETGPVLLGNFIHLSVCKTHC